MHPRFAQRALIAAIGCFSLASLASGQVVGQVVINEFSYDDSSTDDFEFVELFNTGALAIDISGWTLTNRDTGGLAAGSPFTVPAATSLAPGAFYVLGNATVVPAPNQTGAANFLENDNETVELRDSGGVIVDALLYESNLGRAFAPADVTPQIGRGIWGNHTLIQSTTSTDATLRSWSRLRDGVDTNVNGRDFSQRRATPGASNNLGAIITSYIPEDVDAVAPGTPVGALTGSFRNPRVIDPTSTATLLGTLVLNPNAIPASPQGGNAIIAWDPSGGGNTAFTNDLFQGNGSFDLMAYLDTSSITIPGGESTTYGIMGTHDTFHNFADPDGNLTGDIVTANGQTGLAWVFNKNNAGDNKKLFLVDAGEGGDSSPGALTPADWTVLATIDMSAQASAWYRLSIDYNATTGAVTAIFDNQVFNFATATGLSGEFYVGYRESLAGTPATLRPATFDQVPEPTSLALLAGFGAMALRRRRA
jgi:hypothetical protein